ncbi:translocation/assembly module TamB domain-containing protein [Microbulbifer salipaludis]|uniref:Translocation/assembly module TamB domain-containing protein n=1 Tax=Microbulbifer salipaludis TaxID=187980 RepID=A0ABS3EA82_9GAMM|nr:translocation/assembly module TamB [Microbulbifer salipaludis]MBN8432228.1 translocation/assembly module TamB domain-containing protein [Microbulbifer salipaludis]
MRLRAPRLVVMVATLVMPLLMALFLVGSETGREALTRGGLAIARYYLPDLEINAEGLRSEALGSWYFERLQVRYQERPMVDAQQLTLQVDISRLWRNQIHIPRLSARSLLFDNTLLGEYLQSHVSEEDVEETVEEVDQLTVPPIWLEHLAVEKLIIIDGALEGLPVVSVTGHGSYQWPDRDSALALDVAEIQGQEMRLNVEGQMQSETVYALSFSADEQAGGFLGRKLQLPEGESLDADGRLLLTLAGDDRLAVTIERFSLPLLHHRFGLAGNADVVFTPWSVSTDDLELTVDDTRHSVRGVVDGKAVDLKVRFNRLPLAISQPWQDYLQGGWLSADLVVRGPLKLPSADGTLELRSRYQKQPVHLTGTVETVDDVIELRAARLKFAAAEMAVRGKVDIGAQSLDLQGGVKQLPLADIRRILASLKETRDVEIPAELDGTVERLQVTAVGPWSNPQLTVDLASALSFKNLQADVHGRAAGNLEKFAVRDLLVEGDGLRVGGSGEVNLQGKTLQFQLDVAARGLQPAERFGLPVDPGTEVDLDAVVSVSGPFDNPKMSARLSSDGEYREYRYRLRGGAAGNAEQLTFDRLRLDLYTGGAAPVVENGGQSLVPLPVTEPGDDYPLQQSRERVSGTAALAADSAQARQRGNAWLELNGVVEPKAQRARGSVAGRNIPLGLARLAGVDLPSSLRGELSIDGQFSGPFSAPEATANILGLGEYLGEPWQVQGDVSYGKAQVMLSDVKLLWAGRNQLTADGSLSAQALDLEVRAQAVLMDFEEWISADIADSGELSLFATAKGTPKDPDLTGELKISGRAPALRDDALVQAPLALLLEWQTRSGNLEVTLDARHGSRKAADAEATLAIAPILEQWFRDTPAGESPPLPVDFSASGQADLAALGAFFDPEIHTMRGQLDFSFSADGTSVSPNARGNINLQDGYYEHRPSNTRLRRIVFIAEMDPDTWRIVEASARDADRGRVDLQGAARFSGDAPPSLNFSLNARNAHLLNMPGAKGAFSGELRLTGTTEDALLAGTLNLRPLAVQVEHFIGSSVPEIDVVEVEVYGGESAQRSALMENITLALEVVLDQQSYVRGLGLDSELKGKVDIAGTAADPQASGTLTIVRGKFDLLGKKFELQEGQVQFENNVAAVYVKGVYSYPEGEITAVISGTTDDPKIEFSSSPAAAQDEIFAQLLFGKSLTDISPLQAVRLVGVVRSLQTGTAGFDPLASTRDLVGLDTLDFESEATDDGDQYSLSLGKYITSRIYLELQRSTDPLNPWQAEMQIELRRNLRLDIKSADSEESGGGSVELQWKKDY